MSPSSARWSTISNVGGDVVVARREEAPERGAAAARFGPVGAHVVDEVDPAGVERQPLRRATVDLDGRRERDARRVSAARRPRGVRRRHQPERSAAPTADGARRGRAAAGARAENIQCAPFSIAGRRAALVGGVELVPQAELLDAALGGGVAEVDGVDVGLGDAEAQFGDVVGIDLGRRRAGNDVQPGGVDGRPRAVERGEVLG